MSTITVPKEQFRKVLDDVEVLIEDVAALLDQDDIAQRRLADITKTPSIGRSEQELDDYIARRRA